MITMGMGTLMVLTWGLGTAISPAGNLDVEFEPAEVSFVDRSVSISEVEETPEIEFEDTTPPIETEEKSPTVRMK